MPSYGNDSSNDKYSLRQNTHDEECCTKSGRSRIVVIIVAFLLGALVFYLYCQNSTKSSICGCKATSEEEDSDQEDSGTVG